MNSTWQATRTVKDENTRKLEQVVLAVNQAVLDMTMKRAQSAVTILGMRVRVNSRPEASALISNVLKGTSRAGK